MMSFDEFVKEVCNLIPGYLPKQYEGCTLKVRPYEKLNASYTGLFIMSPAQQGAAPIINLNYLYDMVLDGNDMKCIMDKVVEQVSDVPAYDFQEILDYTKIKDKLVIKVSGIAQNASFLEQVAHKVVEDLAITYHIKFFDLYDNLADCIVTKEHLNLYGISLDQLDQDARKNSFRLAPPMIRPMTSCVYRSVLELTGSEEQARQAAKEGIDHPMYVVTNMQTDAGAAVLFYEGMMEEIHKRLGDYYILPSSIHECILLVDNGEMDPKYLQGMVTDINKTVVSADIKLTDSVYHYGADGFHRVIV